MTARSWAWLSVWLALLGPGPAAGEAGFAVIRAGLRPDGVAGGYLLDADIDYRFSEPAIDALRNGVSLTLALRLQVARERPWWWDETLLEMRHAFRVRYHALSKLYQILGGDGAAPRNFISLNALLEAMGAVRDLPVPAFPRPAPGGRYRASLGVGLDIEALPLPLRPVAYLSPAWYLDSPVYKWTFTD